VGYGDLSPLRERLAFWRIVKLRWPLLADYLAEHPEAVDNLAAQNPPGDLAESAS
jgi:hypothetical protein